MLFEKSVVLRDDEIDGKFTYIIKSFDGEHVTTQEVAYNKNQNLLPGQEVSLSRIPSGSGLPNNMLLDAGADLYRIKPVKTTRQSQLVRLNNIKEMMEIAIKTDSIESLKDEYKNNNNSSMAIFDETGKIYECTSAFSTWYEKRLDSYIRAVNYILFEDINENDEIYSLMDQKWGELADIYNDWCDDVFNQNNSSSLPAKEQLKEIRAKSAQHIGKYFIKANASLEYKRKHNSYSEPSKTL